MVYLCGDTHGFIDTQKIEKWAQDKTFTPKDILIILGDSGILWSKGDNDVINFWKQFPFYTFFIDGNHDNHELIDNLPDVNGFGYVANKIYHLKRGKVYKIAGKNFFTFGGGVSIDKNMRKEGISYWKRELPSYMELKNGIENLARYNFKVDYVLTHTAPMQVASKILKILEIEGQSISYNEEENGLRNYFSSLIEDYNLKFNAWYFGHFHTDRTIYWNYHKFHCLYNSEPVRIT